MQRWVRLLTLTVLFAPAWALATANDFQIYQLGNPTPGAAGYSPVANGNFRAFAREMGAAITNPVLMTPYSLGVDGFAINAELSVLNLSPNASFIMPTQHAFSSPWLMPSIHFRKGLPLSFEVGVRIAALNNSSSGVATGELKWAFTEGIPYFPVVSIRGFISSMFNTPEFTLTSGGLDLSVGKRFALGGMVTLTPYGGYTLGATAAQSGVVDFDRSQSPVTAQATPQAPFVNTAQYNDVVWSNNLFNRVYAGCRFVGGVFQLGAELVYTLPGSFVDAPTDGSPAKSRSLPNVLSINTTIGLDF